MAKNTRELLRFTTAGSVDDGKSTLIGRLLYDSKSIFEDQMDAIKQSSERKGLAHVDLSLLTDGLRSEREHCITIYVAYRYFATPKRKFIIVEQTCRHSYIASLLQIPHIIVCVNKMDLVDYSEEVFNKIVGEYTEFASKLDVN